MRADQFPEMTDMRGRIVGAVLAGLVMALPAHADDFGAAVMRQLQEQGFTEFDMTRTLLGRLRIVATGAAGQREIVLNPLTGEILRDLWLWRDDDGDGENGGRSSDRSGNGGDSGDSSGSGGDDDDGGDDSSGSGSGSGGDNGDDD